MTDTNDEELFNKDTAGNQGGGSGPSGNDEVFDTTRADLEGSLEALVGDDKKFSSAELLAKGYADSQAFIEQLKAENKQMRDELRNSEKLDEILNRVGASGNDRGGEGADRGTPGKTGQEEATITQEEISKLVEGEVTRRESERTAKQNEDQARSLILKRTDNDMQKAKQMLVSAAEELGVSVKYLQEQARISPTAFERLVVGNQKTDTEEDSGNRGTPSASRGGGHSTDALSARDVANRGDGAKPWSYWKKARETMSRSEYYSPQVQNEIFRSRTVLGEDAFYNN